MKSFVAIVFVLLTAAVAGGGVPEETDTMVRIYTGPVFWTGDSALPEAAAVAVSADGRILETYGVVPRDTPWEIVKLPGELALPGLHDAHLHVSGIGKRCEQAARPTGPAPARPRWRPAPCGCRRRRWRGWRTGSRGGAPRAPGR